MSGTGEERWRTRGQQQNSRNPSNQQQQRRGGSRERSSAGGYPNQARQGSGSQGPTAVQGNVWGGAGAGGERPVRTGSAVAMPEEQHVPVRNFNARETRDALRKGFQDAANTADYKQTVYKAPGGDSNSARAGGPWGSRPNTMANGQEFFVQLRKGMAALQQQGTNNTTS